ncbi:hypothetical protein DFH28DRAFT_1082426 [Melampsora americana]|nr:hypothetical protein DFH28DRAFT_1082426 [Melampsora americana]
MSVSSSISEDTNPPNHLKHKEWVQTDHQHDSFVFREVQRCLNESIIEHLDYDFYHVSYLLSVKNQPADLTTSVIEDYEKKKIQNNSSLEIKVPFCLRYPTNEENMKKVKYGKAVIFLDEAKRTIGLFIPPVKDEVVKISELACLRASLIVGTPVDKQPIELSHTPVDQHPESPVPPSNVPHQPQFKTNSKKVGSKKDLGPNFIKTEHKLCSTFNAHLLCYAQVPKHAHYSAAYQQEEIASFTKHIQHFHIFNKALNYAFTPKAYEAAEACMKPYLDYQNNPQGSNSFTMNLLAAHPNPAVGDVTVSLNSQPSAHRDPKDGSVMVSDVVHTNALGGEFLIYEAGLAIECENGSQIVGQFDISLHGIGQVKKDPKLPEHLTTRRFSVAIYSHHKIYEAAARYSALVQGLEFYSDDSLWLPLNDDQSNLTD